VRPLELCIQGLRSYRSGQPPIDFRGRSLVAIVGNTGAGKSSLLEAMCYALFGATTWSERASKSLIADGEHTMLVRFTFELDGVTWCVERSTSRSAYPPPAQRLWRPGDASLQPVTGVDEVNARIRDLTHLSYESFKSAVLLPQNQFSNLLCGRERERALILREVFDLDEIGAVRGRAEAAIERIRPALDARRAQRLRLDPDPAAAAEVAAVRRLAAEGSLERSREVARRHGELAAQATGAGAEAARLRDLAEQLGRAQGDDLAAGYAEVLAEDAGLAEDRAAAARELGQADAEVAAARARLDAAAAEGLTVATLSVARVHLGTLAGQAQSAVDRVAADAAEAAAIVTEQERLAGRAAAREPLARAREQAERELAEGDAAVDAVAARHQDALTRAAAAHQAAAARAQAEAEARARGQAVEAAATELARRQVEERAAVGRLEAARAAQRESQRRASAAHAAHGCAPGEPCPVCTQPLPAGFRPPVAAELERVDAESSEAETAWTAAHGRLEAARGSLAAATAEAERATAHSAAAAAGAATALAHLRELLPCAELAVDPAATLVPLAEAVRTARSRQRLVQETAAGARAALDRFEEEGRRLAATLEERTDRLAARRRETAALLGRLEEARLAIPERFRPAVGASTEDLTALAGAVEAETARLAEVARQHEEAARRSATATRRLADLGRARADRVEARAAVLWRRLAVQAAALATAQRALGAEAYVLQTRAEVPAQHAAALEIGRLASDLRGALATRAAAEERAAAGARAAAETILRVAGVDSAAALAAAVEDLAVSAGVAAEEEARLRAQIPQAAALDAAIAPAEALVAALDQVRRWTGEGGAFERFVSSERQRTLLDVGSDILHRMTRERYRFSAESLEVVSMGTRQARSTSTLSGGETFLASLALALALVQVSRRAGGHVDTLILDEGFGSLDDESLQLALEELSRRAEEQGTFVAVVSHLGAVAQNADDVLYVTREATGSRARWREQIDVEEAQAVERQLHWE
jgi:DNA repair protein SbcC/Rad50